MDAEFLLVGKKTHSTISEARTMRTRHLLVGIFLLAGCFATESVQRVNDADRDYSAASAEDLLEYLIRRYNPGVRVYRDNGRIMLRIRGSLQEPLYVIDGVPLSIGLSAVSVGLHANEVEDVEVVTDIARLSRYGMRRVMLAIEPRIRVGILHNGGIIRGDYLPEIDYINYLPRITVPVLMINGRNDGFFHYQSQQRPMFDLLGTLEEHKSHVVFETGHYLPRGLVAKEAISWLDRYLGPVEIQ